MNWTVVEISLSIIGGSVATFRSLLKVLWSNCFNNTDDNNTGTLATLSLPKRHPGQALENALGNDTAIDAESQWQKYAITEAETSDAISRTGSEEIILTDSRIKEATSVNITHV